MDRKPLEILIIEDNIGDAVLISDMLDDMGLSIHTTVVKDGSAALDRLGKVVQSRVPLPDFVILDLNLPKVHGFDVLAYMKATPELSSVPVVVMTGSLNREDETKARGMGVTDYCSKPSTVEEMDDTIACLRRQLDNLMQIDRKKGSGGPSALLANVLTDHEAGIQPSLPSRGELYFDHVFDIDPWNIWK